MNLIQIQDRLKGMPMQAIMAYANGQNPEVPPYLALGELNRRKQMEKQDAQTPKGSVKDEIEQSLMARNSAQQGILGVPHPSMQQVQPQTQMPSGAPTPQAPEMPAAEGEQYAMGGVVALPVRNEMFNYASGGIIAFAGDEKKNDKETGQRVSNDEEKKPSTYREQMSNLLGFLADIPKNIVSAPGYGASGVNKSGQAVAVPAASVAPPVQEINPASNTNLPEGAKTPAQIAAETNARKDLTREEKDNIINSYTNGYKQLQQSGNTTTPPVATPVVRPQPTGIASNPAGSAAAKFLAQSFTGTTPAAPEWAPPKDEKPIGQKWEQYLTKQEQEDLAAQQKFKDVEQQRAKSALWRNLIAAGEATRGGGGIGALLGGYGKSALAEEEAALGRESEQDKLVRERQLNSAKLTSELENLRRAETRNDSKAIYESKLKVRELEQKEKEFQMRGAADIYREEQANKRNAATIGASHQSEREFVADWLKKNPGKSVSDAIAAYKTLGTGARAEQSYPALVEKYASDWNKMDPMERKNMEKAGVKNVEDYITHMLRITQQNKPGSGLPAGVTVNKVGG
jgi:hypothetical protein